MSIWQAWRNLTGKKVSYTHRRVTPLLLKTIVVFRLPANMANYDGFAWDNTPSK